MTAPLIRAAGSRPALRGRPACILVVFLALCAATPRAQTAANYLIGAQDVLSIQVFEQADLGGKCTVETDGTFSFPYLGRVKAGGLTLRSFETDLKRRLADGYIRNPQVTVGIEQYRSQRVFVMGEVRSPGPVPLTGGMTLIEALSRAGSTSPSASGEVAIVRPPQGARGPTMPSQGSDAEVFRATIRSLESGSQTQNIELQDGDTIFVSRAETIFVFGQVKNPGAYAVQKDTTVLQSLSLAGGITENGAMGRIRVVRIVDGAKQEVKVKLTDTVKPGDTLIVPERYF